MSSPKKKRTMTTQPPNPSLPYDLLLSCVARVSRLYYPTLSLVSKGFRDLLTSPELYQTRSLLGHTESCLYVSFLTDPNPRLYTLCQEPNRMNKKKNSSGKILVPISIPSSPNSPPHSNHLVAVGSNIYNIGGDVPSSSRVSFLDCKSHTWHQAPSMRVARSSSSSTISLLDGKIYVAGDCKDSDSVNWVESFDPKTQTWSSVKSPRAEIRNGCIVKLKSLGIEGKFFLFGDKYEVYNPKDGNWYPIEINGCSICAAPYHSHCVIDNVLFNLFDGIFKWYDYKYKLWKVLYGLEVLLEKLWKRFSTFRGLYDSRKTRNYEFGTRCKMVDYNGNMVVLWAEECDASQEYMIWCAEIELERRNRDKIWGKVKWFDVVLTIPRSCNWWNVNAFSTTV